MREFLASFRCLADFIGERTQEHVPELSDVRNAVQQEWENVRRREASASFYRELRERYTVTVEGAPAPDDPKRQAETQ